MLFPLLATIIGVTIFFYGQRPSVLKKFDQDLPQLLVPQSTGKERQIVSMTKDASMYTERKRRSAIIGVHGCNGTKNKPIRESNKTAGFTNGAVEAYMLSSICNIQPVVPPVCVTNIYDGGFPDDDFQDILDGGSFGLNDIYYDGGNPFSNFLNVLDGGAPLSTFLNSFNGGTTSSNFTNTLDGLDPPSDAMDILYSRLNDIQTLDGGEPLRSDVTFFDGGGPSSNFVSVFDGLDPLSNVMDVVYSRLKDIQNLDGGKPNTNLC